MRLPTTEEFDAVKFALWNTFEILLMVLAMTAVVSVALKHLRAVNTWISKRRPDSLDGQNRFPSRHVH